MEAMPQAKSCFLSDYMSLCDMSLDDDEKSFTLFIIHKICKIYNVDAEPVTTKRWTELENVLTYFDFFKAH